MLLALFLQNNNLDQEQIQKLVIADDGVCSDP